MKCYSLSIPMVLLVSLATAQTNIFPQDGNVGIGTTSPEVPLKIVRTGTNAGSEYASLNILTNGSGNLYGPIIYLNATSGSGGRNWGLVSSGGLDASATGASGNFAIYDAGVGSRLVINSLGNVGIGTNNPTTGRLVTQGLITSQTFTTLNAGHNDAYNLYAGGDGYINGSRHSILWSQNNLTLGRFGTEYNLSRDQIDFVWTDQYNKGASAHESMRLTADGHLGIGTADTRGYKLAVNGKIRAQEVKVEALPWPDYVFKKDYKLLTLQDIENHIKERGHLPGIPSAVEVKANGIDLGEMNAKLLQKIEELTLHLIDLKKANSNLTRRVSQLENKR